MSLWYRKWGFLWASLLVPKNGFPFNLEQSDLWEGFRAVLEMGWWSIPCFVSWLGRVPDTVERAGLGSQKDLHPYPGSPRALSRPLNCCERHLWIGNNKAYSELLGEFTYRRIFKTVAPWQNWVKTWMCFYLLISKGCKTAGIQETRC